MVVTNMRKRGTQRQYSAASITIVCSSPGRENSFCGQEYGTLSDAGFSP